MPSRRAIRQRPSKLLLLVGSLVLTLAATLIVGIAMTDSVVRWVFLRRLQSDVAEVRREGMVYVCRHAAEDAALRDDLGRMLLNADDVRLRAAIVESLRCAGVWGPDFGEAWVAQLQRAAYDASVSVRVAVGTQLARTAMRGHPIIDHRRVAESLDRLLADDEPIVRLAGLRAAMARDRRDDDRLAVMVQDDDPRVAYTAQLWFGLLAREAKIPYTGDPALLPVDVDDLSDDPPALARARMWAIEQTVADRVVLSETGLDDPALRAWRPYAIAGKPADWAAMISYQGDDPALVLRRWRAILAMPLESAALDRLEQLSRALTDQTPEPVAAAAMSRLMPLADDDAPLTWPGDDGRVLVDLAMFENARPGRHDVEFADDMPDLVHVAAVRAARNVHEIDLLAMFDTDEPSVRRLAVLTAFDRLSPDERRALADRLSHTFVDTHRIAGALLAGMIGDDGLLERRLEREQVWVVRQYLQLGRMMAGAQTSVDTSALIARQDIDELDVVFAMLQAGRVKPGLDHLLDPLAGSRERLRVQLDQQRFWPVLRRFLPVEAPRFWLWADPALQTFQCDLLRTWYLMHARHM